MHIILKNRKKEKKNNKKFSSYFFRAPTTLILDSGFYTKKKHLVCKEPFDKICEENSGITKVLGAFSSLGKTEIIGCEEVTTCQKDCYQNLV